MVLPDLLVLLLQDTRMQEVVERMEPMVLALVAVAVVVAVVAKPVRFAIMVQAMAEAEAEAVVLPVLLEREVTVEEVHLLYS